MNALSTEVFLQARQQQEVAWYEIWVVGWVIQLAVTAFPHSIPCTWELCTGALSWKRDRERERERYAFP